MDGLTYIPLIAFTLVAFLFIYLSFDELIERGLSFANLGRCLLKVGASSLFLLPVAAILFGLDGQWIIFIGITLILLLGAFAFLISQVLKLRRQPE